MGGEHLKVNGTREYLENGGVFKDNGKGEYLENGGSM